MAFSTRIVSLLPIVVSCSFVAPVFAASTVLNPPDLNLPNYNRIPVGHIGALEGGAYIARSRGSEALWYNVAGLSLEEGNTVSANALLVEFTHAELEGLGTSSDTDGFSQIPTFFGTAFDLNDIADNNLSMGFIVTTPNSYNQHVKLEQESYDAGTTLTTSSVLDSTINIKFIQPQIGISYRKAQRWSFGLSTWLSYATANTNESLALRARNPDASVRLSQVQFSNGDHKALDIGLALGAQWLMNEQWTFGLRIKTPAIALHRESSFNLEITQDLVNELNEISYRDNDLNYNIRYPLSIGFGAAYETQSWVLEGDLTYYQNTGNYGVYKSDELVDLLSYNKTTTAVTNVQVPFNTVRTESEDIINIAIGGHYLFNEQLALHLGFYTDFSPVKSKDDSVYSKVDMYGLTIGISKIGEINTSSFGINYTWGSDDFDVSDSFSAADGEGKINLNNIGFVFATSFRY